MALVIFPWWVCLLHGQANFKGTGRTLISSRDQKGPQNLAFISLDLFGISCKQSVFRTLCLLPWVLESIWKHLDTSFIPDIDQAGESCYPKSKRWETAELRAMLQQTICRNVLFRASLLISSLQDSTKLGAMLYLGIDSPRRLDSCWTYRSGCLQIHFGVVSTEPKRKRERAGRRVTPTPCLGASLKFLAFNGLCHKVLWCSRSEDQCFSLDTFLVNTMSTSGQNGTGFDNIPGSKQHWTIFSGLGRWVAS